MALPFYYNPATNEFESTIQSLGTRFGLNEISTARKTLSPTKSYAEKPYNWEEGDWTDPNDDSVGGTKILEDFDISTATMQKDGGRIGFKRGNITTHPIAPLTADQAKIFKLLQEKKLPTHHVGDSDQMAKRFSKPWEKLTNVQRQNFKHQLFPYYSKMLSETTGMISREHLAKLLTEKLGVSINRFQVVGRGGTRAGLSKRTEFAVKLEELLQPTKYTQKTSFYKIPTAKDIRELKKLVKITPSGSLKNLTAENMVILNKKFAPLYKKGTIPSIEIVSKALPNMSVTQIGNATIRLAQLYNGKEFKLFSNLNEDVRKTFEKIKTDKKTAEKIFKLTQGQKFHNPYYSAMYRISLDTIDEKLGNKRGTFADLKLQARKLLTENKLPVYDAKAPKSYGFNINEIVGVSGSAKSKAAEFSQFIDVMEGNLNQNILTGYQSKLSQARVRIEANPALFESEAKYINKMASRLEKEHGVKLARLRPSETVSKYYSPKRLAELTEQGLDIEKASKKAGYTFQFPKGTQTIKEFLKNPKIQKALEMVKTLKGSGRVKAMNALIALVGATTATKLLNTSAEAQTLEPSDKKQEAGISATDVGKGALATAAGYAITHPGKVLKAADKLISPLLLPLPNIAMHAASGEVPDATSAETWLGPVFWKGAMESLNLTKDKWWHKALRAGMKPSTVAKVSGVSAPLLMATAAIDRGKAMSKTFKEAEELGIDVSEYVDRSSGVIEVTDDLYEEIRKRKSTQGMDYAQGGIASLIK